MKRIPSLSESDQTALERMHLSGTTARQRQRAHAVLLSASGYKLDQLADILRADRDTVSGWLDAWQKRGLNGLADAPKSGRRRKIDGSLEVLLRDILIENPSPNMKAMLQAELKKRQTSLLGHREALPETAGFYLPPRSAGSRKSRLHQSKAARPNQSKAARPKGAWASAPPRRREQVPGAVRR